MARIFISYSRSDRLFLDTFLPLIRKVYGNNSLWYDDDIHGGADWWGIILSEIGDCELFVYLISNESLESPYCQAELREALRLNKQILPVIVRRLKPSYPGNAPDDLKPVLKKTHYVDLTDMRDTTGIANLYAAINRLLEQATPSAPQTAQPTPQPPVPDKKESSRWANIPEGPAIIIAAVIGLIGVIAAAVISLSPSPLPNSGNSESSTTTNGPTSQPTPIGGGQGEIAYHSGDEIFVANTNGIGEPRRILGGDGTRYVYPSFSPDGQRIAFFSNKNGSNSVWIADADGTNAVEIGDSESSDWAGLAWSPDSDQIVFSRTVQDTSQLFATNTVGRNLMQFTCGPQGASNPTWSPDGSSIVFRYGNDDESFQLVMINVDQASVSCLSDSDEGWTELTPSNCSSWKPRWSPASGVITYQSNCGDGDDWEIFVMEDIDNPENTRQLTSNNVNDNTPEVSPDGKLIAFSRGSSIVLIDAITGELFRDLETSSGGSNLSWQP